MKKKILYAAFTALLSAVLLTGCNTLHGVGKDIESGGKAIQKSTGK
jgi:entericidin B